MKARAGYPAADCPNRWRNHRRWIRRTWALFAGWVPANLAVFYVLHKLSVPEGWWMFVTPVGYAIVMIVVANITSNFRCPRCGQRFYAWGPWGLGHNSFARKCRNCGLRKWQCGESA
jgi:predicted RNA-binding Zn-ribbon protein involved in translation (DUF1610 family)